ncbi:ResB-like family protein [Singulisphaera sp. GP187]|uniref:cytochrome c biogenesis protein ResB n=1 Tax=Singulisphaera sp. GP187 TaxID=1882752 RepID=UPI000925FA10|nr:cytochrome c biogenesis protein ResB [Singulisphaera sp. GP187]SIN82770.1 ResB-like family protein [Singulisphaera sp. GP187]
MATATKKNPSSPSHPVDSRSGVVGGILGVFDAIYRFLASLKLAVFSLASLASVLAYATFFESWYGASAVQEWIYQTKWFAVLLAFLGANILCAALIRFPWKKRQTGFVITHVGLLTLLAGSFYSLKTADEGQVGMVEGQSRQELVRIDYPVIRVWPIDPETKKPTDEEYRLPFRPGNFAWGPGSPRPRSVVGSVASTLTAGMFDARKDDGEVLTSPQDPIKFVVKSHIPASAWTTAHVADPAGIPMVKVRVQAKAPGQVRPMDAFGSGQGEDRWITPTDDKLIQVFKRLNRVVKRQGPATIAFTYVDRPELVEDFLNPPKDSGPSGIARFRYRDKANQAKTYEWKLEDQKDKTVTLPDSDLIVTFKGATLIPAGLDDLLGDPDIPVAHFKIKRGDGPEADYYGWALMPMVPSLIPNPDKPELSKEPLAEISYFLPPTLDKAAGRLGLIEILGTPQGTLYHRIFGRGKGAVAEVRGVGPLAKNKEIVAFGGNPGMPMTISFEVEDYLTGGREEQVCEPIVLPKGQQSNGLAASLVAMTVKNGDRPTTKEFWIRRSPTLEPVPQRVSFPDGDYDVVYDVDRKPLAFSLKLDDFKVEFDPGTQQASSFTSKVRLSDDTMAIKNKPHTISMNEPMTHRGYTFYQASYAREQDPHTGRETGRFQSIFQVGIDPGRSIKYLGCLLIVMGAFVQFYMRAGLFSDGGKRERALAEAKARAKAKPGEHSPVANDVEVVSESDETL